jgi:hypothetical protein
MLAFKSHLTVSISIRPINSNVQHEHYVKSIKLNDNNLINVSRGFFSVEHANFMYWVFGFHLGSIQMECDFFLDFKIKIAN